MKKKIQINTAFITFFQIPTLIYRYFQFKNNTIHNVENKSFIYRILCKLLSRITYYVFITQLFKKTHYLSLKIH